MTQMRAVLLQLWRSEAEVRVEIPGPVEEVDRSKQLGECIEDCDTANSATADAIGCKERGEERVDAHGDDKQDARPRKALPLFLCLLLSS